MILDLENNAARVPLVLLWLIRTPAVRFVGQTVNAILLYQRHRHLQPRILPLLIPPLLLFQNQLVDQTVIILNHQLDWYLQVEAPFLHVGER